MLKKIICALLCALMLMTIAACSEGEGEAADTTAETKAGIAADTGDMFAMLDYENPLVTQFERNFTNLYLADGVEHTEKAQVPAINIDLPGANALSEKMLGFFNDMYGEHFAALAAAEDDVADTLLVDFGYYSEVTEDVDVLAVVTLAHETIIGVDSSVKAEVYYYDPLADIELSMDDYLAYCNTTMNEILSKFSQTDTAKEIIEFSGPLTGNEINYVLYKGENVFEVCSGGEHYPIQNVEITVDPTDIDISSIELG